MFSLQGKVAVVTGAGSGIGQSIANTLAAAGAFVYATDRDEKGIQETVAQIEAAGGQATFKVLDVTSEENCNALAAQVLQEKGKIDVVVNNAGIGAVGTIIQATADELDRLYQVNVRGVFNVSKAFIGPMVEAKSGSIVNLASIGGIVGIVDRLTYCTTKFAVVGLTKSMALDHAKDGVRVNCICPGRVETPFVQARLAEYPDPAAAYKQMSETQAVGRMGRPDEIAAAALYLASDEAAFVTGSSHIIDGGFSAGK